jgi:CRP/FNR family cyclic AMP-dependent transcriptional regulator
MMSLQQDVDVLRNIPLFAKVEPSKLKLLAFTAERLSFNADQELFHQGDPGDSLYIILEGEAKVTVDSPSGPITVARVGKNDFFGDIAILCDVPRTATVTATKPLATLRITKELFFELVVQFPQISVEIMRELARRLEKTTRDYGEAMKRLKALA